MKQEYFPLAGLVVVSAFLGFAAPLISFVAASAFETPGTTSTLEASAACIIPALYLAFCQFWVAPRGRGRFWAKLLTVVVLTAPSLLSRFAPAPRIPWLASVCLGSVVGALIAHWLTTRTQRETPAGDSTDRGSRSRRYLLAGFILLSAVALVIPIGVIPLAVTDTTPGLNAGAFGVFLGVTVVFDLLAAALLAVLYALCSGLNAHGLTPRSAMFILCAIFGLITTGLMIATSVVVDRARLCA
jgi:hypothetical protein